jgi:hypothetical protein
MSVEQHAAFLFEKHPRLLQIQIEETGETRFWFGIGLSSPLLVVDDSSYINAPASMWFTDALDTHDERIEASGLVDMRDAVLVFRDEATAAGVVLPQVWHRTMVEEPAE